MKLALENIGTDGVGVSVLVGEAPSDVDQSITYSGFDGNHTILINNVVKKKKSGNNITIKLHKNSFRFLLNLNRLMPKMHKYKAMPTVIAINNITHLVFE